MSQPQTLSIVNTNGSINFDSLASYNCTSSTYSVNSNDEFRLTSTNNITAKSENGNVNIISDIGIIDIISDLNSNNAIKIEATNTHGGIIQHAGTGGINLNTSNGDIDLLSSGSNINIGVSPIGTPAYLQTQNLVLECYNNLDANAADMYFVSSDIISFISNTGNIQFGTSTTTSPVLKFENGNIIINQQTSNLDYQLDVAVSHPSNVKNGYNGIVVNTVVSNVAADLTLQTSNALGDGTQCILSLGSFGLDNKYSIFQTYLAYQSSNVVIRLDGPSYSQNFIDNGFGRDFVYADIGRQIYWPSIDRIDTILSLGSLITSTSDSSNISVTGTYTGNTSRVYLLQIDSLSTPNTFKWSNNGGFSFQQIYVPIKNNNTQYTAINYLLNTILPLTDLTSLQITQLVSYLSPENAVIYGSSILYAYKNTLVLGNNSNVGDVDIAINSMTVFNNIKNFLTSALPGATIYSNTSDAYPYRLNVLYTTDNSVNYLLSQTSLPPNNTSIGTFILGNNGNGDGNWAKTYPGLNPLKISFYQNNKLLIQLTYYDTTPSITIKDYIQSTGDFSVGSGTYDGTNFYISSDIDKNITVYRDPILVTHADWMLYRLKKYIDRGFLIYFDNQTQIDTWTNTLWMTPTSTPFSGYYDTYFVCPFNLKPVDYSQTWILVPNIIIINPLIEIYLELGLSVIFTAATGFFYNQQFTFQTKITAIVSNPVSIPIPETMYSLQSFYSYIETTTPSDIVIKTNKSEKMRITGDGAIGIQTNIPNASLDLNCNYNKVLMVSQKITGYQINPSISYLEYGGYVIVWNSQDTAGLINNFNVYGQRYMADGTRYGQNFKINNNTANNQSFPSVSGSKLQNSNHFIVVWGSNHIITGSYNVYFQVYHNNIPLSTTDKILDSLATPSTNQIYPKVAGLHNGNYAIVWSADQGGDGIFAIYCSIVGDDNNSTIIKNKFLINNPSPYSRNYPYIASLPEADIYYPNGFVVGYMTAIESGADPRYTVAIRVFNYNGTVSSAEIPITSVGSTAYSSISDGLLSIAEIEKHIVNGEINIDNLSLGSFVLSFYRSYQADATLYNINDSVSGLLSGATASINALYPNTRTITLANVSNRFLISEEINIVSSNPLIGNIVEKIETINFINNNTANITLSTGSKNVLAYCFKSNVSQVSDAIWYKQVNTTLLYNDLERYTGNSSIFVYKRPLAAVTVDNNGTALISWSNGSIPSVYYQLINTDTGDFISTEQRLTSQYDGLKQRDQVVTHLQSIEGSDFGFVISWDNQSLDLDSAGIYQQLIGYKHSLFSLEDGNSNLLFNHQSQLGIGITSPNSTLHIKSQLSSSYNDPVNNCGITIQNTSKHVITNQPLQSINFSDGNNNLLNKIQSYNSLRYDDLYPQPTNLVGFYKFDQTEGTQVIDYSSASTNLNIANLPVYVNTNGILNNFDIEKCWVPGIINNSLLFNGNNNYIYVESNALNNLNTLLEVSTHALSISLWINIPSNVAVNSRYDLVSNGGNLSLAGTYLLSVNDVSVNGKMVLSSSVIVNGTNNISLIGTTKLNDSKWHHIVETVDVSSGSNCVIKLYVDGVMENSINTSGIINSIQHTTYKTYFGSRDGNTNLFCGNMDELRFYKSILSLSEITDLYYYGNPNLPNKASLILSSNENATYNQSIIIDDKGKINNLSSRPLPYSILSGEIIAYKDNSNIFGIGTKFLNELTVGDIIILGINQDLEYTVISIIDDTHATIDRRGYGGPEVSYAYLSVLRRPSIYTFFDNSNSIRGHIDNYGNMMIGDSKPSSMLEISGYSNNVNNLPELSISNLTYDSAQFSRMTAINFKGYDNVNKIPIELGRIETSHYGSSSDNKSIMKLSVNNGTTRNNVMSLTSNGNIGIGGGTSGQNSPLTLIHATMQDTSKDCELLLQSNYNNSVLSSVFDERSDLYFGGISSMTETINPNIKYRVLSAISGSNDSNTKALDGRLDFMTNNESNGNGIETRMSINNIGNVGVSIINPVSTFQVAPELRTTGQINTIVTTTTGGTVINLSNNIFSVLSNEQRNLYVNGYVIVENNILTRATILSINNSNQITVNADLSAFVGNVIHVHPAGLNVIGSGSQSGFTGVNTSTPTSVFSVSGSLSLSILTVTSNFSLDLNNYTVLCNTNSNNITITLPVNSTAIKGRIYIIKKANVSNNCYINPNGVLIDNNAGTYTVNNYAQVQSDGTNWWLIAFA